MLKAVSSFSKTFSPLVQQNRSIKYRKPLSIPRPKGKRFYVRVKPELDQAEQAFLKNHWSLYKSQMRSIYQLFKTEHKFSGEKSEVVQNEIERKKQIIEKCLLMNEEMNQTILKIQLKDLEIKKEKEMELEKEKLNKMLERDAMYKEVVEKRVKDLEAKSKTFVDPNNLEYEIEKVLNSLENYNFCVDGQGNRYVDYERGIKLERISAASS